MRATRSPKLQDLKCLLSSQKALLGTSAQLYTCFLRMSTRIFIANSLKLKANILVPDIYSIGKKKLFAKDQKDANFRVKQIVR